MTEKQDEEARRRVAWAAIQILAEDDEALEQEKYKDGGLTDEEWERHEQEREDERGFYEPLNRDWTTLSAIPGEEEPEVPEDYLGLLDSLSE